MGLFSFIGGILGGGAQKKASEKATKAQVDAYNRGIDLQNQQYQQTRQDYLPYTQAGTSAIGDLSGLIGLNGADAQASAIEALKGNPLYGSLHRNGEEALLQNASATGGLRGSNTARSLADFGSDVLAKVYDSQIGNLGGLASLGVGATGSVANFGANNAASVSALLGNIGQAKATNYLTKGGITAGQLGSAGSFLDSAVSAGLPSGGGGFSLGSALKSILG